VKAKVLSGFSLGGGKFAQPPEELELTPKEFARYSAAGYVGPVEIKEEPAPASTPASDKKAGGDKGKGKADG